MLIKALIRDNIAINSHPEGCEENIVQQINFIKQQHKLTDKRK